MQRLTYCTVERLSKRRNEEDSDRYAQLPIPYAPDSPARVQGSDCLLACWLRANLPDGTNTSSPASSAPCVLFVHTASVKRARSIKEFWHIICRLTRMSSVQAPQFLGYLDRDPPQMAAETFRSSTKVNQIPLSRSVLLTKNILGAKTTTSFQSRRLDHATTSEYCSAGSVHPSCPSSI